jgi:hypothetical protein
MRLSFRTAGAGPARELGVDPRRMDAPEARRAEATIAKWEWESRDASRQRRRSTAALGAAGLGLRRQPLLRASLAAAGAGAR